jgi:hypothetical protein
VYTPEARLTRERALIPIDEPDTICILSLSLPPPSLPPLVGLSILCSRVPVEWGAGHNAQFADYRVAGRLSAPRGETLLLLPPQPVEHYKASALALERPVGGRGLGGGGWGVARGVGGWGVEHMCNGVWREAAVAGIKSVMQVMRHCPYGVAGKVRRRGLCGGRGTTARRRTLCQICSPARMQSLQPL